MAGSPDCAVRQRRQAPDGPIIIELLELLFWFHKIFLFLTYNAVLITDELGRPHTDAQSVNSIVGFLIIGSQPLSLYNYSAERRKALRRGLGRLTAKGRILDDPG